MSCLLIVSWVIEVEYTLTAIPQLGKKKDKNQFWHFDRCFLDTTNLHFLFKKTKKRRESCITAQPSLMY